MATQREREIEALRSKLASLEEAVIREKKERETLELAHEQLLSTLAEESLSFDSFVRCFFKEIRRSVTRIEREQTRTTQKNEPAKPSVRKKVVKKRRKRTRIKPTVKIPAGRYSNIPAEPEKVFEVKEKGPRPKVLKAYAEEVGLEHFLNQCRLPEEG